MPRFAWYVEEGPKSRMSTFQYCFPHPGFGTYWLSALKYSWVDMIWSQLQTGARCFEASGIASMSRCPVCRWMASTQKSAYQSAYMVMKAEAKPTSQLWSLHGSLWLVTLDLLWQTLQGSLPCTWYEFYSLVYFVIICILNCRSEEFINPGYTFITLIILTPASSEAFIHEPAFVHLCAKWNVYHQDPGCVAPSDGYWSRGCVPQWDWCCLPRISITVIYRI